MHYPTLMLVADNKLITIVIILLLIAKDILIHLFLSLSLNITEGVCGKPASGRKTKAVAVSTGNMGDIYTYICKNGYEYSGNLNSVCLGDKWTLDDNPPTCTGMLIRKTDLDDFHLLRRFI